MRSSPVRDLVVGIFVLIGLTAIAYLSLSVGGGISFARGGSLTLIATFDQIGGLAERAPVNISGVKVGQVESIELDEDMRARVTLEVDGGLELPIDTSASIMTSGLLGNQYISLQPGGEEDVLRSGEEVSFTESAVILERLIGQLVHTTGGEE